MRLKVEGDEGLINLYFFNLFKCFNELELNVIFIGYYVVFSKIFCDSMGNSCGVGFVW